MRRACAVDGNHNRIADALRKVGAWVWSTAPLGNGFPDLLVWYKNQFILFEVKDGALPPSKRELSPKEQAFKRGCPGPNFVVRNEVEALEKIGFWGTVSVKVDEHGALVYPVEMTIPGYEAPASEQKPPALPPIRRKRVRARGAP